MISPLQYGSSAREDIMNVPISITQLKKKGLLGKHYALPVILSSTFFEKKKK
jgi:hypothetical protein